MASDLVPANAVLQQPLDLNINKLAAPFLPQRHTVQNPSQDHDTRTPSTLAADLKAQKDLFSRLRFAYTKQVEKERTLDYLVNHAVPQVVSDAELHELEHETASQKAALKERKLRVAETLSELEALAKGVSQRHETLQEHIEFLANHTQRTAELEQTARELQAAQPVTSTDPEMNLSLAETEALVAAREHELQTLDNEIARLHDEVSPRQETEMQDLEAEVRRLRDLERVAVDEVESMRRDREVGRTVRGGGADADSLEMQGRWLKAKETVLRSMLEV